MAFIPVARYSMAIEPETRNVGTGPPGECLGALRFRRPLTVGPEDPGMIWVLWPDFPCLPN